VSDSTRSPNPQIYRFSVFEADLRTGELRRNGARIRLQDQPFQVLTLLLSRPKELVTRDEMVRHIWPEGTFVDYDHSLNTAINRLREVLNDSPTTPRFIETLPKRGYRFLGEVEVVMATGAAATPASNGRGSPVTNPVQSAPGTVPLSLDDEMPFVPRALTRTLFVLTQIMYMGFYLAALINMGEIADLLSAVFFTWASVWAGLVVLTALVGIPVRFFLLTAVSFDYSKFRTKYDRIYFGVLLLDAFWALAPLLMAPRIGTGLALAIVAALLYLPFGQRTLVQMAYRNLRHE
jgi:cholera toxin transcriptional activator